jgi:LysR family nod box-dependent transcriptional activator
MRVSSLDLNLLVVLDALLTHENVTRVADQLNVTQPTISNALSRLRQHFRDDLLVLVGRRMVPTPLALHLREPVAEILRQAQRVAITRSAFDPAQTELTVNVIASDYVVNVLLLPVQRRLARLAPGIQLHINHINSATRQRFAEGKIDLLICPEEFIPPTEASARLFADPFVPVVWARNAAVGATLSLEQFQALPYAAIEFGESSHISYSDTYFSRQGIARSVRLRLPNYINLAAAVLETPFLASLPWLLARKHIGGDGLRILRPSFAFPVLSEFLCWPRHLEADPGAQWLREQILVEAQELQKQIEDEAPR